MRNEELARPFKVVKKRKQPPAPGSRGGGPPAFYGRRGFGPVRYGAAPSFAPKSAATAAGSGATAATAAAGGAANPVAVSSSCGDAGGEGAGEEEDDIDEQEGGGEGEGEAGPTSNLYGRWQADSYIARAENGKVPKNARGNIEVPPFASALPIGCVHLQYPGLGGICRLVLPGTWQGAVVCHHVVMGSLAGSIVWWPVLLCAEPLRVGLGR